jgi:hypothetical protein
LEMKTNFTGSLHWRPMMMGWQKSLLDCPP